MKYVGNKKENIQYRKRPGAYAIIINKNDDKVGIVTDGEDYFYLGGGIEKGETEIDALKRDRRNLMSFINVWLMVSVLILKLLSKKLTS